MCFLKLFISLYSIYKFTHNSVYIDNEQRKSHHSYFKRLLNECYPKISCSIDTFWKGSVSRNVNISYIVLLVAIYVKLCNILPIRFSIKRCLEIFIIRNSKLCAWIIKKRFIDLYIYLFTAKIITKCMHKI